MRYRRRIYYSAAQRAEIWDRWQREESMNSIGRLFIEFSAQRCQDRIRELLGSDPAGEIQNR